MSNVQFNADQAKVALTRAKALLADMTPMFQGILQHMIVATRERFQKGVSPAGVPWAPKRPATIERYKQLGYSSAAKPLIGPSRRLGREIQGIVSRDGAVIGSALIYSGVMQEGAGRGAFGKTRRGAPIPWGRIPARPWLGLSEADEAAIVEIADELIGDALGDDT